jgi:hypothetical protein
MKLARPWKSAVRKLTRDWNTPSGVGAVRVVTPVAGSVRVV